MEVVDLLAQNYFGNTRSGSLAGPIGAFIIAAMAVATVLLIRNMNARLRRLPDRFTDDTKSPGDSTSSGSSSPEQRSD